MKKALRLSLKVSRLQEGQGSMEDGNTVPFGDDMIGRRIAHARKLRGLTQRELAEQAPCSKSLIAQVEGGHKPATPSLIGAVARALRVEVTELTGQPYRGRTANTDRIHATIPEIRQALAYWDVAPDLDVPPRTLPELRAEVDQATRLRQAARYVELGTMLPALIKELTVHVHSVQDDGRGEVFALLASAYSAADSMAYKLGYLDLFQIAVERMAWAASQSDDPLMPAVADVRRSMGFMAAGAYDGGLSLLERTGRGLEADLADDRAVLSVYGTVHLRAAILAARDMRSSAAWASMAQASEVAGRIGRDTPDYGLLFGPSNTAIHEAIRRGGDLELPASLSAERTSHHFIDLSRAWLWQGKYEKALSCVLKAETIAAQRTRYHPMARETVARLLDIQRRVPSPLRGLARRMGFAA